MKTAPENSVSDPDHAGVSVADSASADGARLQANLAALKDQYLRLAADFENFRKRTRRDSQQQAAAEKDAFIYELLPVLDNLERAVASEPMQQGVVTALQQLSQLLRRHGIQAVEDVGQPFDPHRHEAVFVRYDSIQPDGVVLEVAERGYCRGEHVFRPAKVVVNDLSRLPGASDAR
jgi:molecular chaperone GrpE